MDEIKVVNELKELLLPPLKEKGYELYDLRLSRKKGSLRLEVIVDKETPISLDDIVMVSNLVDPLLDAYQKLDEPYVLDVSSLGIEKPLKLEKLENYLNKKVALHLIDPFEGMNELEGILSEIKEEEIELKYIVKGRSKKARIARKNIDRGHLAVDFN